MEELACANLPKPPKPKKAKRRRYAKPAQRAPLGKREGGILTASDETAAQTTEAEEEGQAEALREASGYRHLRVRERACY